MGDLKVDNDNAVELVELKIQLEAVEDKIIVLIDKYKSGYECGTCKGTGKIPSSVVEGATKDCTDCKGIGATIVIPDTAKTLPTLGTILSLGPKTDWMELQKQKSQGLNFEIEEAEKRILIRPGAKVLFQPHVGTFLPMKGNIRLKVMRAHEPLCVLYSAEKDLSMNDFIDFDIPFESRY